MTTTTRVYTGVNHAEMLDLFQRWALIVSETPTGLLKHAQLDDSAAGFADMLENLDATDPTDRDVYDAAEHAAEVGLCPDSQDHLMVECHRFGCDNYLEHLSDLAPWGTPAGHLGMWEK